MAEHEKEAAAARECLVRVAATDRWVMYRREAPMPDGRRITYYTFQPIDSNRERAKEAEDR